MHRSGTSLTTGILNALGVSLSEDLMPPTEHNAKGYFESVSIANIHDNILRTLGSAWDASTSERPFPDRWWALPAVQPYKQQLKDLVRREVAAVPEIWGFKDPRTSRLLPLWNEIVAELELDARFVLVVRHPRDVASSLRKRDGMDGTLAEQLWLEHTVDALIHGKDRLKAIVEYTRWFENPIGEAEYMISGLGLPMPPREKLQAVIAELVSEDLRHNKTQQAACLLPFSRELYEALTARDLGQIEMLAQLFDVSRAYTSKVFDRQKHRIAPPAAAVAPAVAQLSPAELARRIDWREDVSPDEVRVYLGAPNPQFRRLANLALAKTAIRNALDYAGATAAAEDYRVQDTLEVIKGLNSMADCDTVYAEALKQLGLQAVAGGQIDTGVGMLQETMLRASITGQARDPRSKKAFRYTHDAEIDRALERAASHFAPPAFPAAPSNPLRLTILCTKLIDQDGPSIVTLKRAQIFRDLGFDVRLVSTGLGGTHGADSAIGQEFLRTGIPWHQIPKGKTSAQVASLVEYFNANPADIAVYMASTSDTAAKMMGCIGAAPVQSWDNRALEPLAGRYDLINQSLSPKQELHTAWPGRARYTGPYVAIADEIDAAEPLSRRLLGVPDDAVLLATFGRVEKCANCDYLEPMATVLAQEPNAWLLIAGPDNDERWDVMRAYFDRCGVTPRVKYLGNRQADGPRLLKSVDLYCDSYPWPGGQSLLDAMQAGLPIAAMRRVTDTDLDPVGESATTSVAQTLLDGVVELAPAGDRDAYVALIRKYVADPELRAQAGARTREKAVRDCSMRESTKRYADLLRELVEVKAGITAAAS